MRNFAFRASIAGMILACVGVGVRNVHGADDVRAQIVAANDVFEEVYALADASRVAALYTEDGEILPPGAKPMTGQDNIAAFWRAAINGGAAGITLTTIEVEQHGDTVIEVGSGEILGAEKNVLDSIKYIVIWKRVDGRWKLHRDMWNSNLAAN